MIRIGLIGFGAIGQCIINTLPEALPANHIIVGILTRSGSAAVSKHPHTDKVPFYTRLGDLLAHKPDVIVECAGQEAVRLYGAKILHANIAMVVSSVGALADDTLYGQLQAASRAGNSKMYLPAGAIGGIDALAAAKLGGLTQVSYRAYKPALAWQGSPAEENTNFETLRHEKVIFRGTAREAATLYPKNANVAAIIALAGLGFDKTKVELIANPSITENRHEITVEGQTGQFKIILTGQPSALNPKTSALTAYSVTKCLVSLDASIVI